MAVSAINGCRDGSGPEKLTGISAGSANAALSAGAAGLVAAYGFNETSGTTAIDASGNENAGIVGSGIDRLSAGKFGGALTFKRGYVTVPNAATLMLTTGMTLEAWVYPTQAGKGYYQTVVMKEQSGQLAYALYGGTPGGPPSTSINTGTGSSTERTVNGTRALPLQAWSHVASTYDGITERLYVNGVQVASQPYSGAIVSSTGALRIGGNTVWGEYFTGNIDEVRIYNRALTASEITTDMNTAIGAAPPPTPSDTARPTISITSPTSNATYATTGTSVSIGGTASDNVGVTQVTWVNSAGGSGTASGTTAWSASNVSLQAGTNTIVVTARDAANNVAADTLVVTVSTTSGSGLVAAYAFDETSGTTTADASGNGNTATIGSGVTRAAAGRFGGAMSFTSGFLTVANAASINLTSAITLEAWVNPSAVSSVWRDIIFKGNDVYYLMATSNSSSRPVSAVKISGETSTTKAVGTAALAANTWTHLAMTYDGSAVRLFLNGVEVVKTAKTGAVTPSTDPLTIGGDAIYGQFFQGLIDEVRVYNRALSASEIQKDMTTAIGGSSGSPAPPADTQAPSIGIMSPSSSGTYSTSASTVAMSGTASDNVGVTQVTWASDRGGSGTASGTTSWSIGSVALQSGTNTITVTARDAAGNAATAKLVVTMSTTTTPPPTGTGEPVFSSGVNTMVYQDNMDEYTDATSMGVAGKTNPRIVPEDSPAWNGKTVPSWVSVITGRGGSGKALRMSNSGDDQTGASFVTMNMPSTPLNSTHVFQYWARMTFSSPLTTPIAVKWFMAWHKNDSNNRTQWALHDHLPCPTTGHPTYWQVYDQKETTCQGNQPVGPYFENVDDGQWHRFTYQFRPNSAAGRRDGFARMWVDGVKIIDVSAATIGVTPPGGSKPWCLADDVDSLVNNDTIAFLWWGGVQTSYKTPAWTNDIDDFSWWIQ